MTLSFDGTELKVLRDLTTLAMVHVSYVFKTFNTVDIKVQFRKNNAMLLLLFHCPDLT